MKLYNLLIVILVIAAVYYFYGRKTVVSRMDVVMNSGLVHNSCQYKPTPFDVRTDFLTPDAAKTKCQYDPSCVAFDHVRVTTDRNHVIPVRTPQTIFYTSVSDNCKDAVIQSGYHKKVVPEMYTGDIPPMPTYGDGDLYIDTKSKKLYQTINWTWVEKSVITTDPGLMFVFTVLDIMLSELKFFFDSASWFIQLPVGSHIVLYTHYRLVDVRIDRWDPRKGGGGDIEFTVKDIPVDVTYTPTYVNVSGFKTYGM